MKPEIYPQNIESEEKILNALFIGMEGSLYSFIKLKQTHFHDDRHKLIFRAMLKIHNAGGKHNDTDRLTEEIEKIKTGIVTPNFLIHLIDYVPLAMDFDYHIKNLKNAALKRELFTIANTIHKAAINPDTLAVDEILKITNALLEASADGIEGGNVSFAESMEAVIKRTEEITEAGKDILGIKTGFYELDNTLNGLVPGRLITLAARPGVGKSALAGNIAINAAKNGHPVQIFSLEMEHTDITRRLLSAESKIRAMDFDRGIKDARQWEAVTATADRLYKIPLFIDDTAGLTNLELLRLARKYKAQHGIELFIVDYTQLMTGQHPNNRVQDVSDISRTLKQISKELSAPVLGLSQLNRDVEKRENKRPKLSDLRESGTIEQDSDQIVFIWKNPSDDNTFFIVAKNRTGEAGQFQVDFAADFVQFRNAAKGQTNQEIF